MGRSKTSSEREFIREIYKKIGRDNFNKLLKITDHCPSDIALYDMDCDNSSCDECWRRSLRYDSYIGGISLEEENYY